VVKWDGHVQAKEDRPHCMSKTGLFRDQANRNTKYASFTLYTLLAQKMQVRLVPPAGPRHCRTAARYSQQKMHVHRLVRGIDRKAANSQCAVKSCSRRACAVLTVTT
jgi:hypothetical protein